MQGLGPRLNWLRTALAGRAAVLPMALFNRLSLLPRHALPMLAVFVLSLAVGLGLAIRHPTRVTAEAMMQVPRDQGLSYARWAQVTGDIHNNWLGGVTQSATDDLSSQRLILQTLGTIGLGKLYPDLASLGEAGRQAAVLRLSKDLTLRQPAGSSRLILRFSHKSPETAALVLNTLMQAYLTEHGRRLAQFALIASPVRRGVAGMDTAALSRPIAPSSLGEHSDMERQLAQRRQALSRVERAIADQAPMVRLSLQGVTNSLRADGHDHGFGFNTDFQSLQIERQDKLRDIIALNLKLAQSNKAQNVHLRAPDLDEIAKQSESDKSLDLGAVVGFEPVRILQPAQPPIRDRRHGVFLSLVCLGLSAMAALIVGIILSFRQQGFGSAKLASRKLDLPVFARVGILPEPISSLSRLRFE